MSAMITPRNDAERKVIAAAASGEWAEISDLAAPQLRDGSDAYHVRAELIVVLVRRLNPDWPLHPKGLRILGARIVGVLDLAAETVTTAMWFGACCFDQAPNFRDAHMPGLAFQGCLLPGMTAERMRIDANVFLRGTEFEGELNLTEAQVRGQLAADRAKFRNPGEIAIVGDGLHSKGGLFIRFCEVEGEARFLGAHVGGQLSAIGIKVRNPGKSAFLADGLTTKAGLFLQSAEVEGETRLLGAQIGGVVVAAGAKFRNEKGPAFSADGLVTSGDLFLRFCEVDGETRLIGAQIGGQLVADGAKLHNDGGNAFNGDSLVTKGSLFLRAAEIEGETFLVGAQIAGQLACRNAIFRHPGKRALTAVRLNVGRELLLVEAEFSGWVNLRGAVAGADMLCNGARFSDLVADRAQVRGILGWQKVGLSGTCSWTHARAGQLLDDFDSWKGCSTLSLEGFQFDEFHPEADTRADIRLDWLALVKEFTPQPYENLVRVLKRKGHARDARVVAMAKLRRQADFDLAFASKNGAPELRDRLRRGWDRVLDRTIGYGYETWRILIPALVVMLIGAVIFTIAGFRGAMIGSGEVPFAGFVFAVDSFVPLLDLHQETNWQVGTDPLLGWVFMLYHWLHVAAGWVLSVLAVYGVYRAQANRDEG